MGCEPWQRLFFVANRDAALFTNSEPTSGAAEPCEDPFGGANPVRTPLEARTLAATLLGKEPQEHPFSPRNPLRPKTNPERDFSPRGRLVVC